MNDVCSKDVGPTSGENNQLNGPYDLNMYKSQHFETKSICSIFASYS